MRTIEENWRVKKQVSMNLETSKEKNKVEESYSGNKRCKEDKGDLPCLECQESGNLELSEYRKLKLDS